MPPSCPLCQNQTGAQAVAGPDKREFWHCAHCQLIYVSPNHYPSFQVEKKRYQAHQNTIDDIGYVQFLEQAIAPTLPFLKPNQTGLDYGCGPNPTLSRLVQQHGWKCDDYDPIFVPEMPSQPYDFMFATECIEHFFYPMHDFKRMKQWLKPHGTLTMLTGMWQSLEQFSTWSYARDFTHVCFYHANTMTYIANQMGFTILINDGKRICMFQNNE